MYERDTIPPMTSLNSKHRILITNDYGIHSPGIELLEKIAAELSDDIWVVAPDSERSGAGHSISLTLPIRMRQLGPKRYEISGTPTDCVLMALWQLMTDGLPTVVLSGINSGANLGEDVTYSGTIAAAMEGTLLGIRSIALSQLRPPGGVPDFSPAERFAPQLIRQCIELDEWPKGSFININFPNCLPDEIDGIRLTSQGQRPPGSFTIDARVDARNHPYYWVKISYAEGKASADTDLEAVADNAISVTPIKMDFTDHAWQTKLAAALA